MSSDLGSKLPAAELDNLRHRLKGLCGIFDMLRPSLPEDQDVRQSFEQGLNRLRRVVVNLDLTRGRSS